MSRISVADEPGFALSLIVESWFINLCIDYWLTLIIYIYYYCIDLCILLIIDYWLTCNSKFIIDYHQFGLYCVSS